MTIDDIAHTMNVWVTFEDLIGTTTASHIHAATAVPWTGTAGVATTTPTFTGFPGGVTTGTYTHLFDMTLLSSYNPAFVTANGGTAASAEAALFGAIEDGSAYLNIHTTLPSRRRDPRVPPARAGAGHDAAPRQRPGGDRARRRRIARG